MKQKVRRNAYPDGVTRQDILDAVMTFDTSGAQGFGESTDYDLLLDGRRYPPKAIAGIAASRVAGRHLTPADFSAGEGQKCFNVLRGHGFIIVPKVEERTTEPSAEEWTREEVASAVSAYLRMRRLKEQGTPYSKVAFNRELRGGPLKGRSEGSVEYRMQNISATLADNGLNWIPGYKPARNVGSRVKGLILELLAELSPEEFWPFIPTPDDEAVKAATAAILRGKTKLTKPAGDEIPRKVQRTSTSFARSAAVAAFVLQESNGVCEGCSKPAPFVDDNGSPFLEVHHVEPLGEGGADTVENAVALCPNCHRYFHHGKERQTARTKLYVSIPRLQMTPLKT